MANFRTDKNSENILRHTQNLFREVSGSGFSNESLVAKHLEWLSKAAKLQEQKIDPSTGRALTHQPRDYKEIYSRTFKEALSSLSKEQQTTIKNILAPQGTDYRGKWFEAFDAEISAKAPTFSGGKSLVLESVERALSTNDSRLLMNFAEKHRRLYESREALLRDTGRIINYLPAEALMSHKAGSV